MQIIINPRSWYERIVSHFEQYIQELRNPANELLRQRFGERLTRPF